ncbi:MAG TPA: VIT family protein [Sphingomonas sp.]|nr:VIT family protein [Sphingomonas sp.]
MDEPAPATKGVTLASKLNWLRAGVLGANDGIVSTSSLIFGVAGANASHSTIVLAGIAAIAAGAMSMAVGEYVSVSNQRDVEQAEICRERELIDADPSYELRRLAELLEERGMSPNLAREAADELQQRSPLSALSRVELGIDPAAIVSPWQAAVASMVSFTIGGLIPLVAMLVSPRAIEIWVSGAAVAAALGLSGAISARLGRTPWLPSVLRMALGGAAAMGFTYAIGSIAGTQL